MVGRRAERREIDQLITSAANGHGGAVVVAGEAGIGKSTVIDAVIENLTGFTLVRAAGTEFEQDLLYATLHQLCDPILDHRTKLPAVQQRALEAVFGLGTQTSPDPLMVGLAVRGLLREAAAEQPVCCVIDDAQWVDDASRRALVFVALRVAADPVVLLFAARDVRAVPGIADLPRLGLVGLDDEEARSLVGTATRAGLDAEVFDRILAEARGNPLALLEFAHNVGPFGETGRCRDRDSVVKALVEQFVHRFGQLPTPARELVVLAAAEPVGDIGLLRRAAGLLGLDAADFLLAEQAGLLTMGPRLRFRHSLVRSAVYESVDAPTRRRVHGALADVTDPDVDSDRRAWHRAHAVVDTDESVARELAASADRARLRGGFAAAAAFMERAAHLTPDPDHRAGRLLAAARWQLHAGAPNAARALIAQTDGHTVDEQWRAAARLLRAQIDYQLVHSPQTTATLVDVVSTAAPDQAGETYLEAFTSFMYNQNEPARLTGLRVQIRDRLAGRDLVRPLDLLLKALLDQAMLPVEQAVPAMRAAALAFRTDADPADRWRMNLLCQLVIDLRDDRLMEEVTDRQVEVARRDGVLATLPQALRYQAVSRVSAGRFDDAAALVNEARGVDEMTGRTPIDGAELVLVAFRGDLDRFRELLALNGHGKRPFEITGSHYASAVLNNGLGNYEAALAAALAAQARHQDGFYTIWAVYSELVEAAARVGRPEDASVAMDHLAALARTNPVPWAIAEWQQAQALLGHEDRETLYQQAIDNFSRTRIEPLHARARLTYGEWLRREGRRSEARVELRAAHMMLTRMGAKGFAERARRELHATGEHARRLDANPLSKLTDQERLIAGKVAAGATSKEVAMSLFLSPRTIDAHLRNVYRKLGISSRRQLRELPL
jgi:DNA-binding CsgD family transcriptional regulator/tetratricopeptide (TPR) repeat protein